MSAAQNSIEVRTSNGDRNSATAVKRPEVRPDPSYMDSLREVREPWWGKAIRTVVQGAIPLGVIGFGCFAVRELIRAEGMDNGSKIVGVFAVSLAVVIWGIATQFVGGKNDATHSKNQPDDSAQPRNG